MSHDHLGHAATGGMEGHESPVSSILDTIIGSQQTELLEMLHVPVLHTGVNEVLLLSSFTTNSPGALAFACFLLVIFAILLEVLRLLLWWAENKFMTGGETARASCDCKHCTSLTVSLPGAGDRKNYSAIHDTQDSTESSNTLTTQPSPMSSSIRHMFLGTAGLLQFVIHVASLLFMLIAMTMNVYIILSLGVGSALGKVITIIARKILLEKCQAVGSGDDNGHGAPAGPMLTRSCDKNI
ncbi:uncharacterized protein LOC121870063 isoform X2 [Homarus americanus]|uniref:uncharacterized protein LOC121870063 isoform X2 n=1 Tax=Homarus americanus TaxID=6706 RepID=UPI001C47B942|nr:uncharacterized protein LOC121870063 isoform X2 [Homarus americanus]